MPSALLFLIAAGPACGEAGTPATAPSAATSRPAVELRYGIYLARLAVVTTIAPDGTIERRRTNDQRYGDGEGTWTPTWEVRRGTLSAAQADELARRLADVEGWRGDTFPAVADDGDVTLRVGGRTIRGGQSAEPPPIRALREAIGDWADAAPIVGP